ncbi:cytochrome P450 [Novosphingobium sp. SG751A]|uniref:cytochrome P450 n=1 Tax=Novosphingobium sp. SG751A TaxID=2587000 RepID=UPI0015572770|nr:cytochrome P450 [Novosphingobium sp. SG751A]NOW48010.1 cytochrome P450 [Novosphingobium sp. SG751A]
MAALPAHVPADLVVDFNIFDPPGAEADYIAAWQALRRPGGLGLVWTTAFGGHWIATDGAVIRRLWADAQNLSSQVLAVVPGLGEVMQLIPLQNDGAEHKAFRNPIMKGFAGRHIAALEPAVRALARELIAGVMPRGTCDFMPDFAEIFPVHIFLSMLGVPVEDREKLRPLGAQLTRPDGTMSVVELRDAVDDYLRAHVRQRLAAPGDDLLSRILAEPVQGRAWTLDEALRMARNVLFAGLDTVAAMVGMVAMHLARYPEDQRLLRARPDLIPAAADELMRRYPSASVSRNAVADIDVNGVTIKAGDIVYLPSMLHNLDPTCFDQPEEARFDRGLNPIHHTTFGVGAHRCVGAGLARMEMIVFLQEWLGALPEFAIDPEKPVTMKAGNVGTLTSLPLIWDQRVGTGFSPA